MAVIKKVSANVETNGHNAKDRTAHNSGAARE